MTTCRDFAAEKTVVVSPPSDALRRAIWPELFCGQPAPEHTVELSPEEVEAIVGADLRRTQELPAMPEDAP